MQRCIIVFETKLECLVIRDHSAFPGTEFLSHDSDIIICHFLDVSEAARARLGQTIPARPLSQSLLFLVAPTLIHSNSGGRVPRHEPPAAVPNFADTDSPCTARVSLCEGKHQVRTLRHALCHSNKQPMPSSSRHRLRLTCLGDLQQNRLSHHRDGAPIPRLPPAPGDKGAKAAAIQGPAALQDTHTSPAALANERALLRL